MGWRHPPWWWGETSGVRQVIKRFEWVNDLEEWGEHYSLARSFIIFSCILASFAMRGLSIQMILAQGLPIIGVTALNVGVWHCATLAFITSAALKKAPDQFRATPLYTSAGGALAAALGAAIVTLMLWLVT